MTSEMKQKLPANIPQCAALAGHCENAVIVASRAGIVKPMGLEADGLRQSPHRATTDGSKW